MPRERNRATFEGFGEDVKAAREALGLSRKVLAETVGIDPRYLANIENSGTLPSLPIFYELLTLCKLPAEKYFYPDADGGNSAERERASMKFRLCPDKYLPIIEAAIDGAIRLNEAESE
jgi:transcriptional regulator with XRE-family HTH domain